MRDKKTSNPKIILAYKAYVGTPLLFTFRKILGALPSCARAQSMRVEAYIEELQAESTEVKITAFINDAANASPAF